MLEVTCLALRVGRGLVQQDSAWDVGGRLWLEDTETHYDASLLATPGMRIDPGEKDVVVVEVAQRHKTARSGPSLTKRPSKIGCGELSMRIPRIFPRISPEFPHLPQTLRALMLSLQRLAFWNCSAFNGAVGELTSSMPTALGQAQWIYQVWFTPTGRFIPHMCACINTFG